MTKEEKKYLQREASYFLYPTLPCNLLAGVVLLSFTKLKFKLKLTRKAPNFEWNKHHFIFILYMLYAVCIIFSLNRYISVCRGPFFFFDFQGSREFCCMWYLLVGVVLMSFTKLKFTLFKIILTRKAPNFQWNKHHFIFIFYMLYAVAITLSLN